MTRFTTLTLQVLGIGWSAIPFLLITTILDVEEPFIVPVDAAGDSLTPDQSHLTKIRLARPLLPSADGALVHAGNPSERLLRFLEDLRADMFDGVHGKSIMPFSIMCQYAVWNLSYAEGHV